MPDDFLSDEDWHKLLRRIKKGLVIPVIGPGLVTVKSPEDGLDIPLQQHLAPRLAEFLLLKNPESFTGFNEVARDYLLTGGVRGELYIGLGEILENLTIPPSQTLLDLAGITAFNLFITSTPDPLLARAVAKARPGFDPERGIIRFHPSADPTKNYAAPLSGNFDAPCDLPPSFKGPLVYHILGDYDTVPDFAVWEEDYMEFICGLLQKRDTLTNFFRLLSDRDLLFLGAPSEDWIVRFFLRAARGRRLSDCDKRNYLADSTALLGKPMVFFFDKAAKATRIIDGPPCEFVSQLAARWRDGYGGAPEDPVAFLQRQPDKLLPGYVFISYSRDDLLVAVRVARALSSAGVPVWLDKRELRPGENYERNLEHAVKFDASFFISLISRATEGDATRYVHKERAWAAQKHVDGHVFYLPLVIDDVRPVKLEPPCFDRDKVDRERLSDDTLPTFVSYVRRLVDEYSDSRVLAPRF